MSEPTIGGFFGGGGTSAKFPQQGAKVEGTITKVHPPEQQRDFDTQQPIPGKYQVKIELATEERDPNIDGDEGARTLYVKGWMQGAIGDALRKAGAKEPEVGGKLAVTWSSTAPPSRPGLQGAHQYTATYTPPSKAGSFFQEAGTDNGASKDAPIPDSPPPGIDAEAWKLMPPAAKQAIANVAAAAPPF